MSESTTSGAPPPTIVAPSASVQSVIVRAPSGWQIDKSIGVAVIIAVLAQLVVGIWYAAGAYSQLADHEKRLSHLEMEFEERTKSRDEQMRLLSDTLSDLRTKLAEVGADVVFLKDNRFGHR